MLKEKNPSHHDFDHLAGSWSIEEADAFDAELSLLRTVDPETEA